MSKVVLSPEACKDLDEIWDHVSQDSVVKADALIRRLLSVMFDTLGTLPLGGRARPEFGDDLRSFPVGSYVIIYRVERGVVAVARVLHGARDLDNVFKH